MRKKFGQRSFVAEEMDLTPVIDVVFLLIIFFMLVCQFIEAEKFKVDVPNQISTAQGKNENKAQLTLTVLYDENKHAVCAVGAQKLAALKGKDMAELIKTAINDELVKSTDKTVRLRCDKNIAFGEIKYILSGISNSNAQELDWAVLKN